MQNPEIIILIHETMVQDQERRLLHEQRIQQLAPASGDGPVRMARNGVGHVLISMGMRISTVSRQEASVERSLRTNTPIP